MSRQYFRGGVWPTEKQKLLLRACLFEGEKALDAWASWKATTAFEELDRASLRLVPLLYRNLKTHSVEDKLMGKFKGVYRFTWYKNHLLFNILKKVISTYNEAGIQTLILKGTALTQLYYKDFGLRPMEDIDILIPESNVVEAVDVLKNLGWKPRYRLPHKLTEEFVTSTKGCQFNNSKGEGIDLHWHTLLESCYKNSDSDFWNDAVSVNLGEVKTSTLNPSDMLLHVCIHGAIRSAVPTIRWIADASWILKNSQADIDWNQLILQARKRRLILPLENTLRYLQQLFPSLIPKDVSNVVRNMPVSTIERIENRVKIRYPILITYILKEWFCYLRNRQLESGSKLHFQCNGFISYLQHSLFLDYKWQVPIYSVLRLVKLVVRSIAT